MSRKRMVVLATVFALIGVMGTVVPLAAQEEPVPIAVEVLSPRSVFTDDVRMILRYSFDDDPLTTIRLGDPSRIVTTRITLQPGAVFPWHMHQGPVMVNVAQGELVYVLASDCVRRPYQVGEALLDPGDNVHTAYNRTGGETILIATFFDVDATGPLTITEGIVPPDDCPLTVGTHEH